MKEEEATRCNINPHVATVITAAKRCPLCLELKVSMRTSLRKTGNLCHMFSAKEKPCIAKGSRKRWRKGRQNKTQSNGVLATAQMFLVVMKHNVLFVFQPPKSGYKLQ